MSDGLLIASFVAAAAASLATSWLLVSRIERIGARFGLSEGLLGLLAALAADAPEITAAVTAMAGNRPQIGAGVVIGSNVFNLAALLGVSAVVAGRIALHRRVIALEAMVAVPLALLTLAVSRGGIAPSAGLAIAAALLIPYAVVLGVGRDRLVRLPLPSEMKTWLSRAVLEEESEIEPSLDPHRGRARDGAVAGVAVLVVVGASVAMEQAASTLGTRHDIPEAVVGALILAGVTSIPNAVAALYLARRGRGAATLSTAMNSNALNVAIGLMLPATIVGLMASGESTLVAAWYLGLTICALAVAYRSRGLHRTHGVLIVCAYAAFVATVLVSA